MFASHQHDRIAFLLSCWPEALAEPASCFVRLAVPAGFFKPFARLWKKNASSGCLLSTKMKYNLIFEVIIIMEVIVIIVTMIVDVIIMQVMTIIYNNIYHRPYKDRKLKQFEDEMIRMCP